MLIPNCINLYNYISYKMFSSYLNKFCLSFLPNFREESNFLWRTIVYCLLWNPSEYFGRITEVIWRRSAHIYNTHNIGYLCKY